MLFKLLISLMTKCPSSKPEVSLLIPGVAAAELEAECKTELVNAKYILIFPLQLKQWTTGSTVSIKETVHLIITTLFVFPPNVLI